MRVAAWLKIENTIVQKCSQAQSAKTIKKIMVLQNRVQITAYRLIGIFEDSILQNVIQQQKHIQLYFMRIEHN